MPPVLNTSWETRVAAGEPSATIRVNNLQAIVTGPQDAWGRPARPQPASVSVEVAVVSPFDVSSARDAVDADTVHYGLLSKKVLQIINTVKLDSEASLSLAGLVHLIWEHLTGFVFLDEEAGGVGDSTRVTRQGFLRKGSFQYLNVTVQLPKASLLGNGVSVSSSVSMGDRRASEAALTRATSLAIYGLRVPTLIGVNENERGAKQAVIANLEIDRWANVTDEYCPLEAVITKTMEDSAYETLEKLLHAIASKVTAYLETKHPEQAKIGWRLKISLEKPIAVPFADAPCVELSISTRDISR